MKTPPFRYQREGILFLVRPDQPHSLLADDAGLAKTYELIAATISCGYRPLYVTPASTVENVRDEILLHTHCTDDDIALITSESPQRRRRAIEALGDEQFRIVGYETLGVLHRDYPELYRRIQQGRDLCILDEAHTPENEDTRRGEAVRNIGIERRWFSTATPYRNGVAGMFWILNILDSDRFPNEQLFKEQFCQDLGGLYELNAQLHDIMLRRTKEDTVEYFEDPEAGGPSFADQLKDGRPRVPRQRIISPEEEGSFPLMSIQEQTILWMIVDFRGWAADYNERIAPYGEEINLDTINPLLKFQFIHKAIYEPEYIGLPPPESLYGELDNVVARVLANDQKPILWVQRHLTADTLNERYCQHGNLVLDGRTPARRRIELIKDYQYRPEVRILTANEEALGTGVTITAGHKAVMVQPSWTPTRWIQTLGRHQRVIGLNNLRFAKAYADTVVMIPHFSPELVNSIEDSDLREVIERGTLPAQTFQRIQGGRVVFQVVTEGYRDEAEFFRQFQRSLLASMGLVEPRRYDLTSGVRPSMQAMAAVAETLSPLWSAARGLPEAEEAITQLVAQARFHGDRVREIATVVAKHEILDPIALRFVSSVFELKNRAVREQLLQLAPWLLTNFERLRDDIVGIGEVDLEDGATNILRIFPTVFREHDLPSSARLDKMVLDVAALGRGPDARQLKRSLLFGMVAILGNRDALGLLEFGLSRPRTVRITGSSGENNLPARKAMPISRGFTSTAARCLSNKLWRVCRCLRGNGTQYA